MKVLITTCNCPGKHEKSFLLHAETLEDELIIQGLSGLILKALKAENVKANIEYLTTAELIADSGKPAEPTIEDFPTEIEFTD